MIAHHDPAGPIGKSRSQHAFGFFMGGVFPNDRFGMPGIYRHAGVNVLTQVDDFLSLEKHFSIPLDEVVASGRAGGLKNRELLKTDGNGRYLKVAFHRVTGPRARTLGAKIMRRLPFHRRCGPPKCGM
jgi:hypothetical protein